MKNIFYPSKLLANLKVVILINRFILFSKGSVIMANKAGTCNPMQKGERR